MSIGESDITKVVTLGTGTPVTDPHRQGPSTAVVVNETPYLFDFGPGVVRRVAEAGRRGVLGLEPRRLTRAFLTHMHSDHTVGYPDLMLTPWVMHRDEPLHVYGPPGIARMTHHLREAYQEDVHMRLYGLEPANDRGHRVVVHEIEPGVVYQDDDVEIEAFAVRHGSWPVAFGYAFRTPDRTIVISGDTTPVDEMIEQARGCDILLHEVYSAAMLESRSEAWQRYHREYHTSTIELAEIANEARPGLLVLYHQLFWGIGDEELVAEIRSRYDGDVVSARDLDVF